MTYVVHLCDTQNITSICVKYFLKCMENKIISRQIKLMLHVEWHFVNSEVGSGLMPNDEQQITAS